MANSEDSDSGEENDRQPLGSEKGLNLAGFLFGNIGEDGELEDNFLDEASKRKLGGLQQILGLGSLIQDEDLETADSAGDDYDNNVKDDEAEDFSNINEALTDEAASCSSSDSSEEDENIEQKHDAEKVEIKSEIPDDQNDQNKAGVQDQNSGEDQNESESGPSDAHVKEDADRELMPPPSLPKPKIEQQLTEKQIRRPLAAMLPEKYSGVDIRDLFPEFRPGQVLRFSRLFPIKPSLKPRIWKNVKKRSKKKSDPDESEESSDRKGKSGWVFDFAPYPEDLDAYQEDQAVRFHRPLEEKNDDDDGKEDKERDSRGPKPTDWRWGPAQYWYDMLDLPERTEDFDYGLKIAIKNMTDDLNNSINEDRNANVEADASTKTESGDRDRPKIEIPEDAFLMVTQVNWEDEVIWNGDDIKHKVHQKLNSKTNAAGWVPSSFNRTAGTFSQPGKNSTMPGGIRLQTMQHKKPTNDDETWHSIFPVENEELVYGRWEDEVIWDHENMPVKLDPKIVSLDPNDDNIILGIPEDIDPSTLPSDEPVRKVKIIQKHVKKSRMLLNRSGIINVIEEESPPPPPKSDDKDPFNISNDEFYAPKTQDNLIKVAAGGGILQHATPVVELQVPFVPTHMGPIKLRAFHRPPVKRFSHGPLADYTRLHGVSSLMKYMKKRAKAREVEREAAGGGDIFFMRTFEDVSGQDGELVLFEYMEEHPPLLGLVGMCSKVKNYYKRKPGTEIPASDYNYGELAVAHTSPFLGQMSPGQCIQAFENNLYRSPIYEHRPPSSDFLVIRTRNEFYVREVDGFFVCGQECPLYEVPAPNSKRANNFTRDFLQVFIYRLFWKSRDNPRRIKMDEIKKAFPAHSESSIRKRLKPCAEFHRTGQDSNWWVIKSGFRLPTEDEIRAMVSPEQCCAFFSMIAAEQRLKDAGYGEKSIMAPQDDEDEDAAMKLDDEVKTAPWNTTRAYILAMKGKCLLQLTGPADPTGKAGEGFSYVRIPNKPTNKEEVEQQPKRTVTGTDADLRKLPLKDARAILRQNGVPEDEIKKLSRWEVIDVVRTLSTEKVKAGEDGDHKFSRGNRFSIAEHHERYREECQRIFDVQNSVLASNEVLSSDEAETSSEDDNNDDEDLDEMGKNIEKMLSNKKSSSQIQREREEMERRDLRKMILDGEAKQKEMKKKQQEGDTTAVPKVLRITRVFRNESGKEYTRTEIVRKPLVVETYVRLRQTKDEAFIKQFASMDEQIKEEMKKEKRRLQEQLRRIKRNQEKERLGEMSKRMKNKSAKIDLKLKCGACGGKGHMRTNKACPKFVPDEFDESLNTSFTEREDEMERDIDSFEDDTDLVNVDGTKVKLSGKVLKHADEMRRRSMILKVPKQAMLKRRRAGTVEHCDYLTNKNYRPAKRRRTDPLITLGSILDKILCELRMMEESTQFWQPVNTKKVTDYLEKIKRPMTLQNIRDNVQKKKYHSREEFLSDVNQIVDNSTVYNGENDIITVNAKKVLVVVIDKLSEKEEFLMRLEKAINPLLDDNDQVALTYILQSILNEKLKTMQEAWPFMKPVNRKQLKVYYEMIKEPMDLETIEKKVLKHSYHSRYDFLHDIELIYKNSLQYNGETSEYTMKAKKLLETTQETLDNYTDHLEVLEAKIREVQQRAIDQADVDSLGTSFADYEDATKFMEAQINPLTGKRKRGRPRKYKPSTSQDYIDVGLEARSPSDFVEEGNSRSNLEDDLQYSSDDELEVEEDEDDWQEVDNENITVTVAGDGRQFTADDQSAAHALVSMGDNATAFYSQGEVVVQGEEEIDENYDPTDFLHNLGQPQEVDAGQHPAEANAEEMQMYDVGENVTGVGVPVELHHAEDGSMVINPIPPASSVDVVNDDLDISDSDDDDESEQQQAGSHQPHAAPDPPPDEDGIWF